jgi:hypothetical protein
VQNVVHRTTQLSASTADQSASRRLRKHQASFDDIRKALASAPVLALRDAERDYILRTNASNRAIRGDLAQKKP